MSDWLISLDKNAYALRLCRFNERKNEARLYEAVTFPDNPWRGCELYLRRCKVFGYLTEAKTDFVIDILDVNGDIIQEFSVTKKGFEYLRRTLKFRVDKGASHD